MKLDFLTLLDRYELKARLLPALLSSLVVAPTVAVLFSDSLGWPYSLSIGGGLGAACAVGLTYVASAAGRHYEKRLWPRWPHDAPTNRWLHPDDASCSQAQKQVWYSAIKRLLGLDILGAIAQGEPGELDLIINDAVRELRSQFRHKKIGALLSIHNEDYGFARNLAGLNLICWIPTASLSAVIAWAAHFIVGAELIWGVLASSALVLCLLLLRILPSYVRQRADRYTENFFGALMQLHHESERNVPLGGVDDDS